MDANASIPIGFSANVRVFVRACTKGNAAIVQLFLQHRAIANNTGTDLMSPLQAAMFKPDNGKVIHLLLNSGADVNDFGPSLPRRGPFSSLDIKAYESNIRILLRHGATTSRLPDADKAYIQYMIEQDTIRTQLMTLATAQAASNPNSPAHRLIPGQSILGLIGSFVGLSQ
jgi:hypothetical protein